MLPLFNINQYLFQSHGNKNSSQPLNMFVLKNRCNINRPELGMILRGVHLNLISSISTQYTNHFQRSICDCHSKQFISHLSASLQIAFTPANK